MTYIWKINMQAFELDSVYTSLAQAIEQAGSKRELFLAMLSLKLITELDDISEVERSISRVLHDLQTHENSHEKPHNGSSTT